MYFIDRVQWELTGGHRVLARTCRWARGARFVLSAEPRPDQLALAVVFLREGLVAMMGPSAVHAAAFAGDLCLMDALGACLVSVARADLSSGLQAATQLLSAGISVGMKLHVVMGAQLRVLCPIWMRLPPGGGKLGWLGGVGHRALRPPLAPMALLSTAVTLQRQRAPSSRLLRCLGTHMTMNMLELPVRHTCQLLLLLDKKNIKNRSVGCRRV